MFGTFYTYRDFSQTVPSWPPEKSSNTGPVRVQKLPVKLHDILSRKQFSSIITWCPHGRAFVILNSKQFEQVVMPEYFEYCNYKSFTRLINAWSFRRITTNGPDKGAYYHEVRFWSIILCCQALYFFPFELIVN
jgi:hypothetical protein